jgi:hypothetical protein
MDADIHRGRSMDSARPDALFDPYPDPSLLAQDVVRLQLDALQNNDLMPDNDGIRIAYRFASPKNREALGTIDDFIAIVKNALYEPLIGFEKAELGTVRSSFSGDQATQQVWLYRGGRSRGVFRWVLSRQGDGEHAGCWLVDAVIRVM